MNDIGVIFLGNGGFTVVDSDLFDQLNQFNWSRHKNGYAYRCDRGETVLMHRAVNQTPDDLETDHKNRFRLDNTKRNLRALTRSQNHQNKTVMATSKSGVQGVCWDKKHKKWVAQICVNKNHVWLGFHDSVEKASEAYQNARAKYFVQS